MVGGEARVIEGEGAGLYSLGRWEALLGERGVMSALMLSGDHCSRPWLLNWPE